jgi:hypothetical protein
MIDQITKLALAIIIILILIIVLKRQNVMKNWVIILIIVLILIIILKYSSSTIEKFWCRHDPEIYQLSGGMSPCSTTPWDTTYPYNHSSHYYYYPEAWDYQHNLQYFLPSYSLPYPYRFYQPGFW